jgi:hypothetical protein
MNSAKEPRLSEERNEVGMGEYWNKIEGLSILIGKGMYRGGKKHYHFATN